MAIWSWLSDRASGIFLHISSLPSEQGIGCFDDAAFRFIKFLSDSGMKYWQVCPLNPTGFGDSPYQSPASFAGNQYFIDLSALANEGLLSQKDLKILSGFPNEQVDFGRLYENFWPILQIAYKNFLQNSDFERSFIRYCEDSDWWLSDYASFMALKDKFFGKIWSDWPKEYSDYASAQVAISRDRALQSQVQFYKFVQWVFDRQWKNLRKFAKKQGVDIIGDLPIFVGFDSADVWANREIFKLSANGTPAVVAGVPPDAFSKTGQLWGNPLYDWGTLEADNFSWWTKRVHRCTELYDVIRIDHFRGFCDYWEVPAREKTATNGKWVKSIGLPFFQHVKNTFPNSKFIAENLGILNAEVDKLLKESGLPGMKVLHFAFDNDAKNKYLLHEHEKNCVLYLGTHDNNTTIGWFNSLSDERQQQVQEYLQISGNDMAWDIIKKAYPSPARLLILTMQDILNLGPEARLNTPSQEGGNWSWRMSNAQLEHLYKVKTPQYLKRIGKIYGRC